MKKSIASLELAALTSELQLLVESKISQIYQVDDEFFFQLHKGEKKILRIVPGKIINLNQEKKSSLRPAGFCLQLRKYLNNAFIRKITQKGSERILILEIEKQEKYQLIIELFAPGNLILVDKTNIILAAYHQQKFKDRFIRPKEKYVAPPATLNWKELTEVKLNKIIQESTRKNLAATLAIELGLGGLYAEEICKLSQVDKDKQSTETSKEEVKLLLKNLNNVLDQIKNPQGFIYAEQITPFHLQDLEPLQKTPTYSEALETIKLNIKTSPYEKKIISQKKIIEEQEKSVKKQEKSIDRNNHKADLIYQKYQPLNKLLNIIQELKKTKEWTEIKKALQKEKKIKQINLKEKKIVVDL